LSIKATYIKAGQMCVDVGNWLQRSITIFVFLSYLSIAEMLKVQNLSRVNIFQKGKYFPRDMEDSPRPALAESNFKVRDVTCPVRN
jgi:hypothetical protein